LYKRFKLAKEPQYNEDKHKKTRTARGGVCFSTTTEFKEMSESNPRKIVYDKVQKNQERKKITKRL